MFGGKILAKRPSRTNMDNGRQTVMTMMMMIAGTI